ncbi:major capsid family protein [Scytonema hofmannii]|nr:major capsid family protein [Scytonema hofmannii]
MTQVYEKPIPKYKSREHFPVSDEGGPAAEMIGIDLYEEVGMAKIITSYSGDWPRVDVVASRHWAHVRGLGDSYGYNFQEVRSSAATGRNLSDRRAMAAKRFIMKSENEIAYLGDESSGLLGALTYPTTPRVVSDIKLTDPAVPAQAKLDRLNSWVRVPWYLAEFEITAVLFSKEDFGYLNSTTKSEDSDTFLMELFRKANPNINYVDWCSQCEGSGINGSNTMLAYVRDPDHIVLHIPQDFEQLPPNDKGKEVEIDCHERCGGVSMIQALSAVIVENL